MTSFRLSFDSDIVASETPPQFRGDAAALHHPLMSRRDGTGAEHGDDRPSDHRPSVSEGDHMTPGWRSSTTDSVVPSCLKTPKKQNEDRRHKRAAAYPGQSNVEHADNEAGHD